MKIIDYTHKENIFSDLSEYINTYYNITNNENETNNNISSDYNENRKILYFDIETTGLSAKNSTLYLIGVLWNDKGIINIRQWFNDDGYCEDELISSFNEFCADFTHLVHFNGLTFDVPYIKEKAAKYALNTDHINKLIQFDIYKEIRAFKNVLGLVNVKQVTIEKYIGIDREDTYNGGELINVYQRYVARPDEEKEHLLLLHNHDDLLGMPAISNLLRYKALKNNSVISDISIHIEKDVAVDNNKMIIDATLDDNLYLPKRLLYTGKNGIYFNAFNNNATIIIPIVFASLKHYFKDYKNYYYLTNENIVIHKDVAAYVDSRNKENATKQNCYVAKEDSFIICSDKDSINTDIFQKDLKDKVYYRTVDSLLNANKTVQIEYVKYILNQFLT